MAVDEAFTGSSRSEGITGTLTDWPRRWIIMTFLRTAVWEYGMAGHTLGKIFAFGEQVEICCSVGFCCVGSLDTGDERCSTGEKSRVVATYGGSIDVHAYTVMNESTTYATSIRVAMAIYIYI